MELVQVMTWNIDSGHAMNDRAQKDVNRDVSTIAQPRSDVNIATTDLLDKYEDVSMSMKYADVFDVLGKFSGQLHFQLDEAVPPVQLPARRLPHRSAREHASAYPPLGPGRFFGTRQRAARMGVCHGRCKTGQWFGTSVH